RSRSHPGRPSIRLLALQIFRYGAVLLRQGLNSGLVGAGVDFQLATHLAINLDDHDLSLHDGLAASSGLPRQQGPVMPVEFPDGVNPWTASLSAPHHPAMNSRRRICRL